MNKVTATGAGGSQGNNNNNSYINGLNPQDYQEELQAMGITALLEPGINFNFNTTARKFLDEHSFSADQMPQKASPKARPTKTAEERLNEFLFLLFNAPLLTKQFPAKISGLTKFFSNIIKRKSQHFFADLSKQNSNLKDKVAFFILSALKELNKTDLEPERKEYLKDFIKQLVIKAHENESLMKGELQDKSVLSFLEDTFLALVKECQQYKNSAANLFTLIYRLKDETKSRTLTSSDRTQRHPLEAMVELQNALASDHLPNLYSQQAELQKELERIIEPHNHKTETAMQRPEQYFADYLDDHDDHLIYHAQSKPRLIENRELSDYYQAILTNLSIAFQKKDFQDLIIFNPMEFRPTKLLYEVFTSLDLDAGFAKFEEKLCAYIASDNPGDNLEKLLFNNQKSKEPDKTKALTNFFTKLKKILQTNRANISFAHKNDLKIDNKRKALILATGIVESQKQLPKLTPLIHWTASSDKNIIDQHLTSSLIDREFGGKDQSTKLYALPYLIAKRMKETAEHGNYNTAILPLKGNSKIEGLLNTGKPMHNSMLIITRKDKPGNDDGENTLTPQTSDNFSFA